MGGNIILYRYLHISLMWNSWILLVTDYHCSRSAEGLMDMLWICYLKPQLHIHDFGHGRATTHPDLSSRDASA